MPALGNALGLPYRRSSSAWTPQSLTPSWWMTARKESFSNGAAVDQITDWSGNGVHFTSSGTARGTFNATGNNGYPSIDLDGVDDVYATASIGSASTWTLWLVGRLISYTSTKNIFSIDDYVPDSTYILIQMNGTNAVSINSNVANTASVSAGAGTVRAYCVEGSASGITITAHDSTSGTAAGDFTKASSIMRLGRRGDGLYANWGFGEGVFLNRANTTDEKTQMWAYLAAQWGITTP